MIALEEPAAGLASHERVREIYLDGTLDDAELGDALGAGETSGEELVAGTGVALGSGEGESGDSGCNGGKPCARRARLKCACFEAGKYRAV
jgi:hypothetical protein